MCALITTVLRGQVGKCILAAVLAVLLLPVRAHAGETVRLGIVTWIGYGPLYVADKMHFFDKHGVKVKFTNFPDGSLLPSAVASYAVDAATLTYDQVLPPVSRGQDIRVVMPIDYSAGADAVVASKAIKSVAQLKGRHVALDVGTPSEFLLAYALKRHGMSIEDVKLVNMTASNVASAMASGHVPAGVTWQPHVSEITKLGQGKSYHVIFSSKQAPGLITDVLVFNEKYIKAHPKAVLGMIKGFLDGERFIEEYPAEAYKIVAKAIGTTPEEAGQEYEGVHNPDLEQMMQNFTQSKSVMSFYTSGQIIGSVLMKTGAMHRIPPIPKTLDASFVRSLM